MKKICHIFIAFLMCISLYTPVFAQDNENTTTTISTDTITLDSPYAIVMSVEDSEILYDSATSEIVYPASLTKMMTAIVALEAIDDLSQTISITDEMLDGLLEANASLAGFSSGDTVTLEDIMYGIALPSGADASQAIALYTYSDSETFIAKMNEKAKEIGMTNTNFVNTTGLHDENHYTTVYDMALLLQYCLDNATFRTIFSTASYTTSNGLTFSSTLFSTRETYGYNLPGLIGGKTGFTFPAGHCLASWADNGNFEYIVVTCGGSGGYDEPTHLIDTNTLLEHFDTYTKTIFYQPGDEITSITINHPLHKDETQPVYINEEVYLYYSTLSTIDISHTFPDVVNTTRQPQPISGTLSILENHVSKKTITIHITIEKEQHFLDSLILFFTGS